MPGDPNLQLSTSTTLTMVGKITTTNSNSNCGPGSVTLNATATFGTIEWYNSASGGTPVSTGNNFTTPNITSTTNYFVSAGCTNDRTQITATINPLPVVQNTTITQCDTDATSDGKTTFNLTVNNDLISANYTNETFKYFNSVSSATNEMLSDLIPSEFSFNNTIPSTMPIGVRVYNSATGCSTPAQITLIVPTTNFQPSSRFCLQFVMIFWTPTVIIHLTTTVVTGLQHLIFQPLEQPFYLNCPHLKTTLLTIIK